MSDKSYSRLTALNNQKVYDFVGEFAEHCAPASIYVCDDSKEDELYIRKTALQKGEEHPMALSEQTIHWDGYGDQARDKVNTKYLVYPENLEKMKSLNSLPYEQGYNEIMGIAKGIMKGKDAVVKFFAEGPTESPFYHSLCSVYRFLVCRPFRSDSLQTRRRSIYENERE
jgi:phosphoenolpyruvate carboxykinase (GTP)